MGRCEYRHVSTYRGTHVTFYFSILSFFLIFHCEVKLFFNLVNLPMRM